MQAEMKRDIISAPSLRDTAGADGLPDHSLACLVASDPNAALAIHIHHRKRVAVTP